MLDISLLDISLLDISLLDLANGFTRARKMCLIFSTLNRLLVTFLVSILRRSRVACSLTRSSSIAAVTGRYQLVVDVPEPATIFILLIGIASVGVTRRRAEHQPHESAGAAMPLKEPRQTNSYKALIGNSSPLIRLAASDAKNTARSATFSGSGGYCNGGTGEPSS